jgi:hypothetical protein
MRVSDPLEVILDSAGARKHMVLAFGAKEGLITKGIFPYALYKSYYYKCCSFFTTGISAK